MATTSWPSRDWGMPHSSGEQVLVCPWSFVLGPWAGRSDRYGEGRRTKDQGPGPGGAAKKELRHWKDGALLLRRERHRAAAALGGGGGVEGHGGKLGQSDEHAPGGAGGAA